MYTSLGLLLGVAVVVLQALATHQSPVSLNYTSSVLRLAKVAQIRAYIDPEVDACENFYEHACGMWQRLQPATADKPKTSYLDQLQEVYVRKSVELLNGDLSRDVVMQAGDDDVDKILKKFYDSCRNREALTKLGMEPILQVVDLKGGWPKVTSESWYEYEYDWLRVVAELRHKLGVDILIGMEVIPDYKDQDLHRIKVGAPKLSLSSKEAYLSSSYEKERERYKSKIADKLVKYFPDMTLDWAKEVAAQVLEVEQQLAKGLPDDSKLTLEQTTRERFASDLKAAYGNYVDLSRYLNLIFNQTIYLRVYESPEDYLSNLVEVVRQTPKLTIANYTMWRVLDKLDFAGDEKWCVEKLIEYFPYQMESLFHRNYNTMQTINELRSVWFDIKETFRKELVDGKHLDWMLLESREKAIVKLKEMELEILTHQERNAHFKERAIGVLKLHKEHYYENVINILQWQTEQQMAKFLEKPEVIESDIKLPLYKHTSNQIQIPVIFLQTRFFWDPAYPMAIKYSSMGFFLAQQMLQGFNNVGRRFDKYGYQRNWWDETTQRNYDEIAECFEHQNNERFSKFQGAAVVDPQAVEKIITDSGGLAVAYRAYQKWWDNESKLANETLATLDTTPNQTFLTAFAQLWCADYHKSADEFDELPEALRVNAAIMNLETFASDQKCSKKDSMVPSKKCLLY